MPKPADRAPFKAEGSLADRDLPELVQSLHEARSSGMLTLSNRGIAKNITVQGGRLVFASSTNRDERLGELLLRRGRISLRQLRAASGAVAPGRRLGAVLVDQGVLSPKDLVRAVVEHTQEIVYDGFQWTEGHYAFKDAADSAEAITLRISTPDLIMEGMRRIESWGRVEKGSGGAQARYRRSADYEEVTRFMSLSFEKLSLLTSLHGESTLEAICEESSLPDFDVCRTMWAYRVVGLVRRVDPPPPVVPDEEDEGLGYVIAEE